MFRFTMFCSIVANHVHVCGASANQRRLSPNLLSMLTEYKHHLNKRLIGQNIMIITGLWLSQFELNSVSVCNIHNLNKTCIFETQRDNCIIAIFDFVIIITDKNNLKCQN